MAKIARCDHCGLERPLQGSPAICLPPGWISAIERRAGDYDREYAACSVLCMGHLMADRAEELTPPPVDEEPARRG